MATWVVWANSQSATFFFTRHSLVRAKSEVFVLLYVLFCLSTISRQPAYSRQILHVGVLWFRMCLLPFWGLAAPGGWKKGEMKFSLLWESMGNFCILPDISATRARIHTKYYLCRDNVCRRAPSSCGVHRPLGIGQLPFLFSQRCQM